MEGKDQGGQVLDGGCSERAEPGADGRQRRVLEGRRGWHQHFCPGGDRAAARAGHPAWLRSDAILRASERESQYLPSHCPVDWPRALQAK